MSDTARDYQTLELASTGGLEDFFEVDIPTTADSLDSAADSLTEVPTSADNLQWVSVTQAGALLNKSERTIQRYIKAGKLAAKDDITGKLLVGVPAYADNVAACADVLKIVPTSADIDPGLPTSANIDETASQSFADMPKSVTSELVQPSELEKHLLLIRDLQNQLQAASFRNGYLESKLEDREREIKLLMDSQHKDSWWARFCSWFLGNK